MPRPMPSKCAPRHLSLQEKLEYYSEPGLKDGCRVWTGTLSGSGYGQMWWQGRMQSAHVLSWFNGAGFMPRPGKIICHHCDNPRCIEYDHLFMGTQSDNRNDMYQKGRGADRKGEVHPLSKLTAKEVLAIRDAKGTHSQIALQFEITRQTVGDIKLKRRWSHL